MATKEEISQMLEDRVNACRLVRTPEFDEVCGRKVWVFDLSGYDYSGKLVCGTGTFKDLKTLSYIGYDAGEPLQDSYLEDFFRRKKFLRSSENPEEVRVEDCAICLGTISYGNMAKSLGYYVNQIGGKLNINTEHAVGEIPVFNVAIIDQNCDYDAPPGQEVVRVDLSEFLTPNEFADKLVETLRAKGFKKGFYGSPDGLFSNYRGDGFYQLEGSNIGINSANERFLQRAISEGSIESSPDIFSPSGNGTLPDWFGRFYGPKNYAVTIPDNPLGRASVFENFFRNGVKVEPTDSFKVMLGKFREYFLRQNKSADEIEELLRKNRFLNITELKLHKNISSQFRNIGHIKGSIADKLVTPFSTYYNKSIGIGYGIGYTMGIGLISVVLDDEIKEAMGLIGDRFQCEPSGLPTTLAGAILDNKNRRHWKINNDPEKPIVLVNTGRGINYKPA